MWYDDSTARLDRFSLIALKLTLGLQNLCSFFRFALFDGEIYPLEPIQKGWTDTLLYICDKMFILVHYLSVGIFDICFQLDSKLKNIHLFLDSIDLQKPQTSFSTGISKMWSAFFELSILPEILRILFRFQFYENCRNLNENFYISGHFESPKNADHSWEVPRLWLFHDN